MFGQHSLPSRRTGRLLIALAAVLWSTSGFFVKAPLFSGWPGPLLACWRALFACLVLIPMVRRPRWTWRLLPMVTFFIAMNWFYLSALVKTEASIAIWLQYTAPVWVFFVCVFVWREPVHRRDWVLLACAAAGVGLILAFELRGESAAGVIFGLLSGLTFAGILLSLRWLRAEDPAWLVALNHLAAAAALSPYIAWYPQCWPTGLQWAFVCGLGVLQMGLPYLLFAQGLKSVPGHEASGIALLEPVLVPVWVFVAWHGADNYLAPRWWTLAGGALILSGLLLRYIGQRDPPALGQDDEQPRSETEQRNSNRTHRPDDRAKPAQRD
jgi:drug/metabolite transporter (DMT)-like permease